MNTVGANLFARASKKQLINWIGVKMRIGFYGGCFNPPSNVHINIAKIVIDKYNLDTFF